VTCYRNDDDVRALRGEHTDTCIGAGPDWHPPLTWHDCDGCQPCTKPHCTLCHHQHLTPDHAQTCPKCVGRVRNNLTDLSDLATLAERRLANWWPAASPGLSTSRATETPLIGGDILALTGPGSRALNNPWRDLDEQYDDPTAIAAELAFYADDWATEATSQPVERTLQPALTHVIAYLGRHLTWAAQSYPLFDEFAGVVRGLIDRLQAELRDHEHVIRGVPCLKCGTTLERRARIPQRCRHRRIPQRRADSDGNVEPWPEYDARVTAWFIDHLTCDQGGIPENWRCPNCRRTYNPDQYRNAVAMGNRAFAPAATAAELHERFGIRPATIRKLAQRGQITKRGADHLGRMLYDVDDARAYTAATPTEEPA
jgi:hypothetical protein